MILNDQLIDMSLHNEWTTNVSSLASAVGEKATNTGKTVIWSGRSWREWLPREGAAERGDLGEMASGCVPGGLLGGGAFQKTGDGPRGKATLAHCQRRIRYIMSTKRSP